MINMSFDIKKLIKYRLSDKMHLKINIKIFIYKNNNYLMSFLFMTLKTYF